MTAETAVTIENAVSKAYGNSAPGNAITFVRIQSTMLANSPRVPARKPAAAPRMNPFFTITPATSPAIKGPKEKICRLVFGWTGGFLVHGVF